MSLQRKESVVELKIKLLRAQMLYLEETQEQMNRATHDKLDMILEQTRKTNGSIIELKEKAAVLEQKTHDLEMADANHVKNCPNTNEIKSINEGLLEYKFYKKNPRQIYVAVAAIVIIIVVGIFEFINLFK